MRVIYEKIGFKRRKNGICPICGKLASRGEEFYQTINPWNQKTSEQIIKEETVKMNEWLKKKTYHVKCEPRTNS